MNEMSLHDRVAEQAWAVLVAAVSLEDVSINVTAHAIAANVLEILPELCEAEQ